MLAVSSAAPPVSTQMLSSVPMNAPPAAPTGTARSAAHIAARIAIVVAFAAVLLLSTRLATKTPEYNWDMLPYMALALSYELDDPAEIHREIYASAKQKISEQAFLDLVDEENWLSSNWSKDASFFADYLPLYKNAGALHSASLSGVSSRGSTRGRDLVDLPGVLCPDRVSDPTLVRTPSAPSVGSPPRHRSCPRAATPVRGATLYGRCDRTPGDGEFKWSSQRCPVLRNEGDR